MLQKDGGGGGGGALPGAGPTGSRPEPAVPPITQGLSSASCPASPYDFATCPLPGAIILPGTGMLYASLVGNVPDVEA